MEVFAVATGGMAVLSLSIQLIQSISSVHTFIRNVEDAPDELVRLGKKLERLKALLEDVHSILERQSSLQGQHFPAPSMTIFNCLQSCEESLQPLQNLMAKYQKPQTHRSSTLVKVARWKTDLSISFKAKDIGGFELCIQQEINNLHAALGTNMTSIMTNVFPVLLKNHQSFMVTNPPSLKTPSTIQDLSPPTVGRRRNPSLMRVSQRTYRVPSALEQFGLYQRKSIRYIGSTDEGVSRRSRCYPDEVVFEEYEYIWSWRFLGYGMTWTQQRPYGSIVPALRTYPLVKEFDLSVRSLMYEGTVQEFQQMFRSGKLHPYTRDSHGESLLHVAASYCRPEICHLLSEYGVKPDLSHHGDSPLIKSIKWSGTRQGDQLETFRVLVLHLDSVDDFDDSEYVWHDTWLHGYMNADLDSIEWLWINSAGVFPDSELRVLRVFLIRILVGRYCLLGTDSESIAQLLVVLTDFGIPDAYLKSCYEFLDLCFRYNHNVLKSRRIGDAVIDILVCLGLDAETYIKRELEHLPDRILGSWSGEKRIVFENHQEQGWILEWEWVYDDTAPGYSVVSEFTILAANTIYAWEWPFWEDQDWEDRREPFARHRFDRRMESKARKARARTGQKRPRRMPGAWI